MKEWSFEYNPFNSRKLIYWAQYWAQIAKGFIPPPILVTLDPINRCNFNCSYCNAAFKMSVSSAEYDDYVVDNIAPFLKKWGVQAVCIAGGGEPLLHKRAGDIIENLVAHNIEVGVVTNGFFLDKYKKALAKCKWVGVSVDAGNAEVFSSLKSMPKKVFHKVVNNISLLHQHAPDLEITYKFLAHPTNIPSIYEGVKIAKSVGCQFFHLRPVGQSWDDLGQPNIFTSLDITVAKAHIELARKDFEDGSFRVFGILHKFSDGWTAQNNFKKCYAVAMTALIQPGNMVGLCCDRRGDPKLELGTFTKLDDILALWNSQKHWDIMKSINLKECPRCTYGPHNQLFEHMVLSDSTCRNFI